MATITIRVDDELRDQIAEAAETRGVTISDYIREAVEVHRSLEPDGELGRPRSEASDVTSLTPFERKVLLMLHRNLLAAHGDLHPHHYDPEGEVNAIKALEGGFAAEYQSEFADTTRHLSPAECELVWDIFDMFRIIQASVDRLKKGWDQVKVEDAAHYGTFQGFDFNDDLEIRLHDYAEYLIKTDKWTEQSEAFSSSNDYGNSHRRMLPTYRSMLRVFKPLWRDAASRGFGSPIGADDLARILLAAPGAQPIQEEETEA